MNPTSWLLTITGLPWLLVVVIWLPLVWWSYRAALGEYQHRTDFQRAWLPSIRPFWLSIVAIVALQPVLSHISWSERDPRIALIVDESLSMDTKDQNLSATERLDLAQNLALYQFAERDRRASLFQRTCQSLQRWRGQARFYADRWLHRHIDLRTWTQLNDSLIVLDKKFREQATHFLGYELLADDLARFEKTLALWLTQWESYAETNRITEEALSGLELLDDLRRRLGLIQEDADQSIIHAADSQLEQALTELTGLSRHQQIQRYLDINTNNLWLTQHRFRMEPQLSAAFSLEDRTADSDIASALRSLAQETQYGEWDAVVIASDGQFTQAEDVRLAVQALHARGTKVGCIAVGSEQVGFDLALQSLWLPQSVKLGDRVQVDGRYIVSGRNSTAIFIEAFVDGVEVSRQSIVRAAGLHEFSFDFIAQTTGTRSIRIDISTKFDELTDSNNSSERYIVVSDTPLRALVIDQFPRWESRHICDILRHHSRVKVDIRYQSVLGQNESFFDERAMSLSNYDLIFIGDCPIHDMKPQLQSKLATYVEKGGFLVCIAGPQAMPRAYPLGSFADLLPVSFGAGLQQSRALKQQIKLTKMSENQAVTRILVDEIENKHLWRSLNPIRIWSHGMIAKADSLVFLQSVAGDPVAVGHEYGNGRVFFLGTDETWRWRTGIGKEVHVRFWSHLIRWGLSNQLRGEHPQLQVSINGSVFSLDQQCLIRIQILAKDDAVVKPSLLIRYPDGKEKISAPSRQIDSRTWEYRVDVQQVGEWSITARHGTLNIAERRSFYVQPTSNREVQFLSLNQSRLEEIAEIGDLPVVSLGYTRPLEELIAAIGVKQNQIRTNWNVWEHPLVLILLVCLPVIEWWYRRRKGLS